MLRPVVMRAPRGLAPAVRGFSSATSAAPKIPLWIDGQEVESSIDTWCVNCATPLGL